MAIRRAAVTPTFAAGLGVVIAAMLAYPMARTVISYGGEPSVGGQPCVQKGCVGARRPGASPAIAAPGSRLVTPRPTAHGKRPRPAAPASPQGGGPAPHHRQALVTYQTMRPWQGGFLGEITIDGPVPAGSGWRLRLSYASARIIGVWGGSVTRIGVHTVLVQPGGGPDGSSGDQGSGIQIFVAVSGSPVTPSVCVFDGMACRSG
jgi:hypothetical protein